jgi:hypothetical protein
MNEAETRAEHIDPALKATGWGVIEGSRVRREYPITLGILAIIRGIFLILSLSTNVIAAARAMRVTGGGFWNISRRPCSSA